MNKAAIPCIADLREDCAAMARKLKVRMYPKQFLRNGYGWELVNALKHWQVHQKRTIGHALLSCITVGSKFAKYSTGSFDSINPC